MKGGEAVGPPLRWANLPCETRDALAGKLVGLYGAESDERAFDDLATDKQQALLLFAGRLGELKLWYAVSRVENVYGLGGVGISFEASEDFAALLAGHPAFTARFSHRRRECGAEFRERKSRRASLHVLAEVPPASSHRWSAHFDLDNPLASPFGAWLHLYREHWRRRVPDWRAIASALKQD